LPSLNSTVNALAIEGAAEQGMREAHSGAAGRFSWRRTPRGVDVQRLDGCAVFQGAGAGEHQRVRLFLADVVATQPADKEIHIIVDNLSRITA
jgi:hypothetical protein